MRYFCGMAKIVQFPVNATPEKFGLQRAFKNKGKGKPKGQLNLFITGKIIKLNQLSAFEEALMLDEQDDKKSARVLYLRAIEENDSAADSFCNLGIIESQEGNYPKAIDCFTQALKHNPRHYEAHYNLANLYAEVGNYNLAKIHYEIAIEVEPSFPNSYFNLGITFAMMKHYRDAVRVLSTYRELSAEDDQHQTDDLIFKLSGLL
jgi:tetratricopeptide (TPR) repeat protein